MSMRYRVVGAHAVSGVEPGGVVDFVESSTVNVAALVDAGHLELLAEDDGGLKPLEELTVLELRNYAGEHAIDLGEARLKADVLDAIRKGEA